jgi:ABC-type oligopeptide transport system substrate-binding subunit/predicted Ser/Thr protein kinase/predicted ATPase
MIGSLLNDRYRIEAELGKGGMGAVYRAFDSRLERQVAVKLVTGYQLETEGRARLLQEAKAIAQLNHPHIVSVYDAGEVDGSPFIVMELVDGVSLHDRRPRETKELARIAGQVCQALEHAHQRGIVHRDLKPENVLIDSGGNAKLMDFGIARSMASRLTQEGQIEGTVFYMAPELATGKEYDGRADLYALGVMLYELTTGELPFQHGDPVAVISQHIHAPVVPPRAKDPSIPPALSRLIVQLMAKSPDDRPSDAGAVIQALGNPNLLDAEAPDQEQLSTLDRIVRGRMIGRQAEFEKARQLWHAAVGGSSQVLLISGEPGVGKSRLLREIITQSEVMGAEVLGAASYAEGGPPYSPFKHILREVLPKASQNGFNLPEYVLADLLSLVPEFRAQYPDVPPNLSEDPKTDQYRLFESFFVFLAALSQHSPLLLYLDDAHWADSGSLSLFRHLARQLGSQPIMLLATYREVELDEARPLHEVLLDLSKEPKTTRVKLNRLSMPQTEELLASFFQEEITPEFLEGIYRETDGNPFFIEEVCKALVESGKLYYENGRWHRPDMSELGIPQSVKVAIQSRVGKLSAETQEVLNQAAVLGREFEFETLLAALGSAEEPVIVALEEAERAQLIEERSQGGRLLLWFSHALIPSTLVEGLRILQRRRLHSRAAAALEQREPENYAALGRHLLEAGQTEKGVDYLLQAGDQARSLYAYREAISNYLQALDYASESEDHVRAARIHMKLGVAYHNAFEFERSREAYERGFTHWKQAGHIRGKALPPAPHALRVAFIPPPTLDPGFVDDSTSSAFTDQLFSGLVELAPDLSVLPNVARAWEVLDDGCTYRFHLRDDVQWTDGHPVTAADFEYSWRRTLDPSTHSVAAKYLFDIRGAQRFNQASGPAEAVGIRAAGDHVLVVELERPASYFLQLLRVASMLPVPRHTIEAFGPGWTDPDKIVTNGPFKLASRDEDRIVMVRNPAYHGRSEGNAVEIEVALIQEKSALLRRDNAGLIQRYEQRQLDVLDLGDLPPQEQERSRQTFADEYLTSPLLDVLYLVFDASRPPFDDVRVRRAFAHALDREALAEVAMRGFCAPATGGMLPPGLVGHLPEIAPKYDPAAARRWLAEAGYGDVSRFPEVECLCPSHWTFWPAAQDVKTQWLEELGVSVEWQSMGWGSFLARLEQKRPNLWLGGWTADYPDPDSFLRLGALHEFRQAWENAEYVELVEGARQTQVHSERMRLYAATQRLLAEEIPLLPLVYPRGHLLLKPWVVEYPLALMRFNYWKDVVIEPHD